MDTSLIESRLTTEFLIFSESRYVLISIVASRKIDTDQHGDILKIEAEIARKYVAC